MLIEKVVCVLSCRVVLCRPFSLPEGLGFKAFMRVMRPSYEIPKRPTIMKYIKVRVIDR